jgi:TonB family protein
MSLLGYSGQPSTGRYMNFMIVLSLALHVMLLLVIAGLRLPGKMERPLASYQVSLVTMPTPSADPTPAPQPVQPETPKAPEPPVVRPTQQVVKETAPPPPQPVRLAPTPHVRALEPIRTKPMPPPVPTPAPTVRQEAPQPPVPAPAPPPVVRHSEPKPTPVPVPPPARPVLNRDVLRGIALPSEVPKLGQVNPIPAGTPKETRAQTQTDVQKILNNLTVPEPTPVSPQPATLPPPTRISPPRPSVSEEVDRQLQKLEQPPPKVDTPKPAAPVESQVASKPPAAARTPVTVLQADGVVNGNPYLARIQHLISAQWIAPKVDVTGQPLQVVVKFRLDKSGRVSNIVVERTSGNEYYDLAAIRAVQSAKTLPPFPSEMSQLYLDTHFSFAVGESVS